MVVENGPDDFEFKDDDSKIVRIFKTKKIHMWFREPLPEDSIIHDLK